MYEWKVSESFEFYHKYFTWLQIEYFSFSGAPGKTFQLLENEGETENMGWGYAFSAHVGQEGITQTILLAGSLDEYLFWLESEFSSLHLAPPRLLPGHFLVHLWEYSRKRFTIFLDFLENSQESDFKNINAGARPDCEMCLRFYYMLCKAHILDTGINKKFKIELCIGRKYLKKSNTS